MVFNSPSYDLRIQNTENRQSVDPRNSKQIKDVFIWLLNNFTFWENAHFTDWEYIGLLSSTCKALNHIKYNPQIWNKIATDMQRLYALTFIIEREICMTTYDISFSESRTKNFKIEKNIKLIYTNPSNHHLMAYYRQITSNAKAKLQTMPCISSITNIRNRITCAKRSKRVFGIYKPLQPMDMAKILKNFYKHGIRQMIYFHYIKNSYQSLKARHDVYDALKKIQRNQKNIHLYVRTEHIQYIIDILKNKLTASIA
jgi:hypothetical protein